MFNMTLSTSNGATLSNDTVSVANRIVIMHRSDADVSSLTSTYIFVKSPGQHVVFCNRDGVYIFITQPPEMKIVTTSLFLLLLDGTSSSLIFLNSSYASVSLLFIRPRHGVGKILAGNKIFVNSAFVSNHTATPTATKVEQEYHDL